MKNTIPDKQLSERFAAMWRIVGNSPLLEIKFTYKGQLRTIYAKSEQFNITGSIKDRMALYVLQKAYEKGDIRKESVIYEATSGNTGISFSAIGRSFGHKVNILMPDWMSKERVDIITSLGATVIPVSKEQGGFLGSIRMSEELAAKTEHAFLPKQFANEANVEAHYHTTGTELYNQLQTLGKTPDAFVAGVGTGGTVMGVGKLLREKNPQVKVHPLEPSESPTMSTGYKVGKHRIQGVSDEFIPQIVKLDELDEIISVSDGDSIIMAQKLASELGLAVGISSGGNFLGALIAQNNLGSDAVVATVFADSNKKYLSTDLLRTEPIKENYLSNDIQLIEYNVVGRICQMCNE